MKREFYSLFYEEKFNLLLKRAVREFDTLEIQKNIEEKRLILGKKLEDFLLDKIFKIGGFLKKIFAAKSCAFLGGLLIIALSVFIRSTRDIGHDSAACLEITQKFLNGGKYYLDFFENNLPLVFYFLSLAQIPAKFFALNPIITLEIFTNLVGILALYFTARILRRSPAAKDQTTFNIIILAFACGFFLRVFTLSFNEFGTKSTFYLAFAMPYIAFWLLEKPKKSDQIIAGILAALIFCLKPHYGVLVIVFELARLLEKKSIKPIFRLQNYVTLALLVLYLVFLFLHFSDYISAIPSFSKIYFNSFFAIFFVIKEDLLPFVFLMALCFLFVKTPGLLKTLFIASLASLLVVMAEFLGGMDQRFAFYSLSLPFFILLFVEIVKNNYINWRRDAIALLVIFMIPQFDKTIFTAIIFNLGAFWWIFAIILSAKWRKILKNENLQLGGFFGRYFLQRNFISWLCFSALTIFTIVLFFNKKTGNLSWFLSAIILILLVRFYQNLYQKFFTTKKFSQFSACVIFTIFSYFLSLHISAIFEKTYIANANDEMIKTIKNNTENNEEIEVISSVISHTYPMINYAGKQNKLPSLQLFFLYEKINNKVEINSAENYLFSRIKEQMLSPKNKLVFVETKSNYVDNLCVIGFLEHYFSDPEFKKIFLQNYTFLNRIIQYKNLEKKVDLYADENSKSSRIIEREIEVYVRK
ncbi:MAG: hypothetical protein V4694_04150 [Pseudomonadota bacterium]